MYNGEPGFWLKNGEVAKNLYVAFTAKAAIDAGASSNKEPSLRPEWRADYFAANIGDPDGYKIEIALPISLGSTNKTCEPSTHLRPAAIIRHRAAAAAIGLAAGFYSIQVG